MIQYELIATGNGKTYKKTVTLEQFLKMELNKNFKYQLFQIGFSQYENVVELK